MTVQTASAPAQVATPTKRIIKKAAVLGAGIMGARIACHFANIGLDVVLLDMAPRELNDAEKAAGLSLDHPKVKNRIVNDLFNTAVKTNPSPIYDKALLSRIKLGNFADNMNWLSDVDWTVEVVVERLDIKRIIYEQVEKHRKPGSLITSNTSGIPMAQLVEGRSEDFIKNFAGTHFFNPPRYLPLLEIIPAPGSDKEVIDFLMHYGDRYLGKKTVLCKDTPAFIANRVGIYGIMDIFALTTKHGLKVEEVDKLTGPIIGNASSATFRTCDLVGLDTAVKVAQGIYDNCPNDERRDLFLLPDYVKYMVDNNMHGDKTGQGFYKKIKTPDGKKEIYSLNFATKEYVPQQKVSSATLDQCKKIDDIGKRFKLLTNADDKYGAFMRELAYGQFSYVSFRVPEIADELYNIDAGLSAGFGWKYGPFEKWDFLGVPETVAAMKAAGFKVAPWVDEMLALGFTSFYKTEAGIRHYYDQFSKGYKALPGGDAFIILDTLRPSKVVWENNGSAIYDLGDGVLNIEFRSKMNSLGADVLEGINKAIDLAEASYSGLIIGNQGDNFTVGADLFMVSVMAMQGEWDKLEYAVKYFQDTVMRIRYSGIPVVVAPHGMTLGGGCEMTMHADIAQAAAETYIGLVEVGVGLIPGGGGTKEHAVRLSDRYKTGDVDVNVMTEVFTSIATAKVATSAMEGYGIGVLRKGRDRITVNKARLIADAKATVLELAAAGYVQAPQRKDIRVLGKQGLAAVYAGTYQMEFAGYASAHDRLIAEKIGYVLCGGDLSYPTLVTEQYLLDLEREAFLSLLGTEKTRERIAHTLQTGKPLRN